MRNECYSLSEKQIGSGIVYRYTGNDKTEVLPVAEERFNVMLRLGKKPVWLCKQWVSQNEFAAVFSTKVK